MVVVFRAREEWLILRTNKSTNWTYCSRTMWRRSGGVFLPASARRQRRPTPTTAPLVVAAVAKLSTTTTTVRPPVAAVAGERQQWPRRRCHHHHYHDQHHDHHTNTAGSRRCFSFFEDVGNGSEETLRRTTTTNPTTINTNTKTNTHTTTPRMGTAVYTLYGETCAFSVKALPPEFRAISPRGLLVLDAHQRGRFLFEWTPAVPTPNRSATTTTTPNSTSTTTKTTYQWSATTRLALTVEEAGSLLARVDRGDPTVTFQRRIPSYNTSPTSADDGNNTSITKICLATRLELPSVMPKNTVPVMDGISLLVDYMYPDKEEEAGGERRRAAWGQIPHPPSDPQGLVRRAVVV